MLGFLNFLLFIKKTKLINLIDEVTTNKKRVNFEIFSFVIFFPNHLKFI